MQLTGVSFQRNLKHLTQRVLFSFRVFGCFGFGQRQSPQKAFVNRHRDRAHLQTPCGPPHDTVLLSCSLRHRVLYLYHFLEAHFVLFSAFGRSAGRAAQNPVSDRPLAHGMGIVFRGTVPGVLIEQSLQTLELSVLKVQKDQPQVKQTPLCQQLAFYMKLREKMEHEMKFQPRECSQENSSSQHVCTTSCVSFQARLASRQPSSSAAKLSPKFPTRRRPRGRKSSRSY